MVSTSIYKFSSTKVIPLGSCAFRQPFAQSHCKFIHGYRLQAKFWFGCNELDANNWVVDFGGLKELKTTLETVFDHTTIVWREDPELALFKMLGEKGVIDLRIFNDGVGIEMFARFCLNQANELVTKNTNGRCNCIKVEVWEHENNSAIYELLSAGTSTDSSSSSIPTINITDTIIGIPSTLQETSPVITPLTKIISSPIPTKPETPPLHNTKVYNTFKDPFAGTSWGNNARRTK